MEASITKRRERCSTRRADQSYVLTRVAVSVLCTRSPGAVRTPMARGHGECKFENASFSFANSIILNAWGYVVVRSRDFSSL